MLQYSSHRWLVSTVTSLVASLGASWSLSATSFQSSLIAPYPEFLSTSKSYDGPVEV